MMNVVVISYIIVLHVIMNRWKELLTKMEELLASGIPLPMLVPSFPLLSSCYSLFILSILEFYDISDTRTHTIKFSIFNFRYMLLGQTLHT